MSQNQNKYDINSFSVKGLIVDDWKPGQNPDWDERYLLIQTTDMTAKYTNIVKVLVSGVVAKKANLSFAVSEVGKYVHIGGYINGRYYKNKNVHFQTLKASFIEFVEQEPDRIAPSKVSEYIEDDDLPF